MLSQVISPTSAAQWLPSDQEAQWDVFVAQHPLGLVYHLSAWKRVLERAFPHIRGRFLVLRDNATGAIQAGLPLYTVKSWLLGNRVVSVPFASFCDLLIASPAEFEQFLPHIHEVCDRVSARRLEVRTWQTARLFASSSLAPAIGFKHHLLLLDKDREAIFANCAKSSVRQKVAKARKAGVVVVEADNDDSVKTCHAILADTRRRLCLPPMPLAFFAAMRSELSPLHMKIFLALQGGRPVGCHLILTAGDLWTSEYSANTDDALHGVNQLLYWETIERAQAAGAKAFSFGRTAVANEGLLEYKRRWGTLEEDLVDFKLSLRGAPVADATKPDRSDPSAAYRVARFVAGRVPKPIFHRIGDFCYRHLG